MYGQNNYDSKSINENVRNKITSGEKEKKITFQINMSMSTFLGSTVLHISQCQHMCPVLIKRRHQMEQLSSTKQQKIENVTIANKYVN